MKNKILSLCDSYEELLEVNRELHISKPNGKTFASYLKRRQEDLHHEISNIKDSLEDLFLT